MGYTESPSWRTPDQPGEAPDMTTEPRADLGFLLNAATRHFRLRLADALAGTGLTPQQAAVLMAIVRSDEGRLTPRAIAESVGTDQATTSGLLVRLTRDGWIAAEPNPGDGRSRFMVLTKKAASALPTVLGAADRVSSQATSCLTPQEVETLRSLLGRLLTGGSPSATEKNAGTR